MQQQQLDIPAGNAEIPTNGMLVARADGTTTFFNSHDALAVVFEQYDGPINRHHRGRLGKAAKELLEDGFEPNVVCAAVHHALRRGRPGLAIDMAQDIVNARNGAHLTAKQWRQMVEAESAGQKIDPEMRAIYNALLDKHFKP